MTKLSKILNFVLYGLIAITAVFAIMFYTGGDVLGETYKTPVYTQGFLNWGIILVFITAIATVLIEIVKVILNPKNAGRTLMSILVLLVITGISYALSDAIPLNLSAYEGTDNVPSMLLLAGTFLHGAYILIGVLVVAILGTEVSRLFK
ncbi:hypothetical protein OAA06_00895 [bacterium]|nr:hypothetical protein [bacterium]